MELMDHKKSLDVKQTKVQRNKSKKKNAQLDFVYMQRWYYFFIYQKVYQSCLCLFLCLSNLPNNYLNLQYWFLYPYS